MGYIHEPNIVAVLHALRVRRAGTVEDILRICGVTAAARALDTLVSQDLAARRQVGAETYFALTSAGFDVDRRASRERLGAGAGALASLYDERFLEVNTRFKALCARWQQEGEQIELVAQASTIHEEIAEFLRSASPLDPLLARYLERLGASMEDFLDGDSSALVGPVGVSYHNTWFELHEDLIATLGRTRAEEAA